MLIKRESKENFYQGPPILVESLTNRIINNRDVPLTNENWRGKNDPTERRRIQNRINQRAFRERKRNGEATKRYHGRSKSVKREFGDEESIIDQSQEEAAKSALNDETGYTPATLPPTVVDHNTGLYWDHGARIINEATTATIVRNIQILDIPLQSLTAQANTYTPRPAAFRSGVHEDLWPTEIQHCILHDLYIDGIPHPQLRENIIRAVSAGHIDAGELSMRMRNAGALEPLEHQLMRVGIMYWNTSNVSGTQNQHQLSGWEVSSGFWQRWPFLLQGCDDFLAITNARRRERGEPPLAPVWNDIHTEHRAL